MKRLLLIAVAVVTAAALLGGVASFALFTANSTPQSQTIVAGTLNIDGQRDQGDTVPGPMFYFGSDQGLLADGYWAPGDTKHKVLQVENTGSLSAILKKISATIDQNSALAGILDVKVTSDAAGANVIAQGTVNDFVAGKAISLLSAPTDLTDLHFWVTLPLDANNDYQGLNLEVTFAVYAEQAANNP